MPGASPSNRSGVHLFAHGSGGTVPGLNNQEIDKIQAAGYAALSWESITDFNAVAGFTEADKMATCVADLELVLAWLVDNADLYHLDLNDVNMGGRSRGSICSWGAAHTNHPGLNISGIYMYNAIPMNAQTDAVFEDFALQPIAASSPPAYLAYGPECPKPINATYCLPTPLVEAGNGQLRPDIHNPRFGQKIVDRYEALGAGDRINISDGMTNANINNIYFYFESFVASLEVNPGPVPPSTPPSAPTPPPSTPTTAQTIGTQPATTPATTTSSSVCKDNNRAIIALAAKQNLTISGCGDKRVKRACSKFTELLEKCCVTCEGATQDSTGGAAPPKALGGNPFANTDDGSNTATAQSTTGPQGGDSSSCARRSRGRRVILQAAAVVVAMAMC